MIRSLPLSASTGAPIPSGTVFAPAIAVNEDGLLSVTSLASATVTSMVWMVSAVLVAGPVDSVALSIDCTSTLSVKVPAVDDTNCSGEVASSAVWAGSEMTQAPGVEPAAPTVWPLISKLPPAGTPVIVTFSVSDGSGGIETLNSAIG